MQEAEEVPHPANAATIMQRASSIATIFFICFIPFIFTVNDIIVGVAGSGWGDDDGAELFTLYVDPAWHRRGVGRTLVGHESRRVREVGAARLDVAVMPGNAPAVLFYERCGFTYTCERPIHAPHGREGGPDHAVVYSLAL